MPIQHPACSGASHLHALFTVGQSFGHFDTFKASETSTVFRNVLKIVQQLCTYRTEALLSKEMAVGLNGF